MTNPDKAFIVVLFLLVHCLRQRQQNYYHSLHLVYFQNVIKFVRIVTVNAHFFIQANGIVIFVWLFSVLFALFPLLGWNSYVSEVSFHNLYAMIKSTTFMNLIHLKYDDLSLGSNCISTSNYKNIFNCILVEKLKLVYHFTTQGMMKENFSFENFFSCVFS